MGLAMTDRVKPQSILSTGCFYAAGYFCLGALLVLGYQTLFWYRQGAWMSYRMWVLLDWVGVQHSPSAPVTRVQPLFDHIWQSFGNCPITIALSLATVVVAALGFVRESAYARAVELRDAH
jgi:hypothetical protein